MQTFTVLDIFRGICAWIIVMFHMTVFSSLPFLNNSFIVHGNVFVDFFFVLSGFVIAYKYEPLREDEFGSFMSRRLVRVYPLHIILLAIFILMEAIKPAFINYFHVNQIQNPNNNIQSFLSNVFLLNSVKIPGVDDVSWNIPSWSVSAEVIAYFIFAVLIITIRKTKWVNKKLLIYCFLVFIASLILTAATGGFTLLYTFDLGFLRGIIGFFTGAACFQIYTRMSEKVKALPVMYFDIAEILMVTIVGCAVSLGDIFNNFGYLYEILFLLTVLLFALEKGFISSALKKLAFLKKSATYSYSIYMTHALTLSVFNIIFFRLLHFPDVAYSYLFVLNLYFVYQTSRLSYIYVEVFFKDTFNKILINRSA